MDECGSTSLNAKQSDFGVFALSAVIIPASRYETVDRRWKAWKTEVWGDPKRRIHEPELRKSRGAFWFEGRTARQNEVRESLSDVLRELDFMLITVVVHRDEYFALHGRDPIDASLPLSVYHMVLDFMSERLVRALHDCFDNARGHLVAEARGPLEDAQLQQEFARLHIDGTSYVSGSWFRQQLQPGIQFGTKPECITGLELADLAARPCAEKVLAPDRTPPRWPEFREKLCSLQRTKHSPLGLKIVPWDDKYVDIWKS